MSVAIINKTRFKTNIAVDLVTACVQWHKNRGRKINTIYLNDARWEQFKGFIQEISPEMDIKNKVHFKDIIVEHSKFLVEPLSVKLENGK